MPSFFGVFGRKKTASPKEPNLPDYIDIVCQRIMSLPQIAFLRPQATTFSPPTIFDDTLAYYYKAIGATISALQDQVSSKQEIAAWIKKLILKINGKAQKTKDEKAKNLGAALIKNIKAITPETIRWEPTNHHVTPEEIINRYSEKMINTADEKTAIDWQRDNQFYINGAYFGPHYRSLIEQHKDNPAEQARIITMFIVESGFGGNTNKFISRNLQQQGILGVSQGLLEDIFSATSDIAAKVTNNRFLVTGHDQLFSYKEISSVQIQDASTGTTYPDAFWFEVNIEFEWLNPTNTLPIMKHFKMKSYAKPIYLPGCNTYLPELVAKFFPSIN
jgi:hypothetical protein